MSRLKLLLTAVLTAVVALMAVGGGLLLTRSADLERGSALKVSPRNPVASEKVSFSGHLTTPVERAVELQVKTGSDWDVVAEGESDDSGGFTLTGAAPEGPGRFRVFAPETSEHDAQVSRTRVLTPQAPTASLIFMPPIAQSKSGTQDLMPVRAQFGPPRTGRAVALERRDDGQWNTLATATTERGKVTFSEVVPADDTRQYRAVAEPYQGAAAVHTPEQKPVAPTPIFSDDFNGNSLDKSKWDYRYTGARFGLRPCAEPSPESVSVKDGALHLIVKKFPASQHKKSKEECPHGEFKNGMIGTEGRFQFKYGIIAMRTRYHYGQGQHGALFAQPTKAVTKVLGDPANSGAEIDVAEYYGDGFRDGGLSHLIHWADKDADGEEKLASAGGIQKSNHLLRPGRTWSDDFHVYSVEWTPNEYIFRVDGHETFRTDRGVSRVDQYLILSLLTSDWEIPKLDMDRINPMRVDWVRVWQG